jgi:hypothetical protein
MNKKPYYNGFFGKACDVTFSVFKKAMWVHFGLSIIVSVVDDDIAKKLWFASVGIVFVSGFASIGLKKMNDKAAWAAFMKRVNER